LVYSVFLQNSPIHDGAVIISGGRLAAAGCFLPLSKEPNIDKKFGTRHRAAIGLTEETDAIVVVVSEEAGEMHLVSAGNVMTNLTEKELDSSLVALMGLRNIAQRNLPQKMKGWIQASKQR